MTDLLWMPPWDGEVEDQVAPWSERGPPKVVGSPNPNYLQEFDATVQKVKEGDQPWLLLDRTAFYAEGGGQPADQGVLTWDGGETRVVDVSKKGVVKHVVEGEVPPPGATVHGTLDWDLRHRHMRMHTSQHLVSGLAWKDLEARTTAAGFDADRCFVEFDRALDADAVALLTDAANALLSRDLRVRVLEEAREVIEQRTGDRQLMARVPPRVRSLRIVEILGEDDVVDYCPCAGTHVARSGEIGRVGDVEVAGARLEYGLK